MASSPITSWQINGETMETVRDFIFLCCKITEDGDCSHEIKRHLLLGGRTMTSLDSILKAETLFCQHRSIQSNYGFSSSHAWLWELDHRETWVLKNWWFWTVVLEETVESSLGIKESKPVNPKGNQSWIFIRRTNAEAEAQYFGHLC